MALPPRFPPPSSFTTTDDGDDSAYSDALGDYYIEKATLSGLKYDAASAGIKETEESIRRMKVHQKGLEEGDRAQIDTAYGFREDLYGLDQTASEMQSRGRRAGAKLGEKALGRARADEDLVYGYELDKLRGRDPLLLARHEKGMADISDTREDNRISSYTAALGSMYGGGSAAGIAGKADRSLASAAQRSQDALGRSEDMLGRETSAARFELGLDIDKTAVQRGAMKSSYDERTAMSEHQRKEDLEQSKREVARLEKQKAADRDDAGYRKARHDLSVKMEDEQRDTTLNIQAIAKELATSSKQPRADQLIAEEKLMLAQRSSTRIQSTFLSSGSY